MKEYENMTLEDKVEDGNVWYREKKCREFSVASFTFWRVFIYKIDQFYVAPKHRAGRN